MRTLRRVRTIRAKPSGRAAVGIAFNALSAAENLAENTLIGTLSLSGAYTGSPTWSLVSTDGSRVKISGANILAGATLIDYETHPTLSFTVGVSGTTPDPIDKLITIPITNVVEDTTPTAFDLGVDQVDVAADDWIYTAVVYALDVDGTCDVAVSGSATSKEYSVNGGAYGTTGQVPQNGSVQGRFKSSPSYLSAVTFTLSIGGNVTSATSDSITATTMANPLAPSLPKPTLVLHNDADSGSTSDNITNIADLIFTAGNLTYGATIHLLRNGVEVDSQIATGTEIEFDYTSTEGVDDVWTIWLELDDEYSESSDDEEVTVDLTAAVVSSVNATTIDFESASLAASVNAAEGQLFWVVTESAVAPTAAQIIAGTDEDDVAAVFADDQAVTVSGAQTIADVTGLDPSTAYYVYFAHRDVAFNLSNVDDDTFTTDAAGGTITYANPDNRLTNVNSSSWTHTSFTFSAGIAVVYLTTADDGGDFLTVHIKGNLATRIAHYNKGCLCYVAVTAGTGTIAVTTTNSISWVELVKIDLIGAAAAPGTEAFTDHGGTNPETFGSVNIADGGVGLAFYTNIAFTTSASLGAWTSCDGTASIAETAAAVGHVALNIRTASSGAITGFSPTVASSLVGYAVNCVLPWAPA